MVSVGGLGMLAYLNQRIAIRFAVIIGYGVILAKAYTWPKEEVGLFLMVSCGLVSIVISILNQMSSRRQS